MKDIINEFLEKEYQEAKRVHQLQPLFERYKNMSKDMVEEYLAQYPGSINLIVSALYCADYIVTSSEVKFELEDTARRKEIIEFWQKISIPNEEMWYEVTHLVAFTYKVASILRKRYYYLLDRGVAKNIASALVSDYYTRHHLEFTKKKLGLPLWWISVLMETALCLNIFSTTRDKWNNLQLKLKELEPGILSQVIGKHFVDETDKEPNPAVPIPYFKESTMFYYFRWKDEETKGEKFESLLPVIKAPRIENEFKNSTKLLGGDYPHLLKYLRLTNKLDTIPLGINFFVVHARTENAEGWMGLLSPIDDINLKEIESLLHLKLSDISSFERYKKELPQVEVFRRGKEEREILEERIEIEEQPKPQGFFAKLFSRFKKDKPPKIKKSAVKKTIPIDAWSRLILDEILIASVSGISLGIEIYDGYREDDFIISGVIESKQKKTPTTSFYSDGTEDIPPTIFYSESPIKFPSEFLDPVIGIVEIAQHFITLSQKGNLLSVVPEEAFFENKINPEVFRLVEFVKGEKVLIGILAEKQAQTAMTYASSEPTYQRRSLLRKANEMIHARRVNTMIDSGKRTLAREINWDEVNKSYENKPLFYEVE